MPMALMTDYGEYGAATLKESLSHPKSLKRTDGTSMRNFPPPMPMKPIALKFISLLAANGCMSLLGVRLCIE